MSMEADGNSYARQRLGQAVECLVDEGPLRIRLTHAAYHLLLLRAIWTVPEASASIAERVSFIVDELAREPLAIKDHRLPRSHVSPKRARALAKEILNLYTEVYGGVIGTLYPPSCSRRWHRAPLDAEDRLGHFG
jgi:hypothetical protein